MNRHKIIILIILLALFLYDQFIIMNMGLNGLLYYALAPTVTMLIITYVIYRGWKSTEEFNSEPNFTNTNIEKAIERLKNEINELRAHGITEDLIRLELILVNNLIAIKSYYEAHKALAEVEKDIASLGGHVNRELIIEYRKANRKIKKALKHQFP